MKLSYRYCGLAGLFVLALLGNDGHAQTSAGAPAVSSQILQQTAANQANPSSESKKGKVVLSRTTAEDGQTTTTGDAAAGTLATPIPAPTAEDADRQALTFTGYDMDARLRPAEQYIAVRALVTVRNDGKAALTRLPLEISSSLTWEQARLAGGPDSPFPVATLNSDSDHTGQLHEATLTLKQPLAPGASLQLDVAYSGTIAQSDKRLVAIGTPEEIARLSDWDRISPGFTGLRGFGNVLWYPTSSVPVVLGDGARLFDEIGEHKQRLVGARFRLSLTVEYAGGTAPNVALINGHLVPLAGPESSASAVADPAIPRVVTAHSGDTTLGFEAPSLFVAERVARPGPNLVLFARPEDEANVPAWLAAANTVTPFLQGWLGKSPRSQLILLDLPEDEDSPFETGALLAAPIRAAAVSDPAHPRPDPLAGVLAHALTHAWVQSPRAWLSEGTAHFLGTLWVEREQGRQHALETLEAARQPLALLEPESPGQDDGQPLVTASNPAYYRTKATYVFWMLRDLVGDASLSAALRAYDPAQDTAPDYFEKLLEQTSARQDLKPFFADWVYADKGLPDLAIDNIFSSPASVPGSYLVAVNLANNGYAQVEVPVSVRTADTSITQQVVLKPRSKVTQRMLIQGTPTEVQLNDGSVPETQAGVQIKTIEAAPAPNPNATSADNPSQPQ